MAKAAKLDGKRKKLLKTLAPHLEEFVINPGMPS